MFNRFLHLTTQKFPSDRPQNGTCRFDDLANNVITDIFGHRHFTRHTIVALTTRLPTRTRTPDVNRHPRPDDIVQPLRGHGFGRRFRLRSGRQHPEQRNGWRQLVRGSVAGVRGCPRHIWPGHAPRRRRQRRRFAQRGYGFERSQRRSCFGTTRKSQRIAIDVRGGFDHSPAHQVSHN